MLESREHLGQSQRGGVSSGRDGDENGGSLPGTSLRRMESGTVAGQMPDLKTTACDLSVLAPPADCSMDLERRVTELPAPLSVLGGALPVYPDAGLQGAPGQRTTMPAYHSSALLANLGLHRLYRSMENLHWAAVPDPGLYAFSAPYGSVDSEFIFRCTATSRWYEGGPEGVAFCPRRASVRRDLPLLPQWLFPGGGEGVLNGDARRGLREKLRLQSIRVTEPNKPLRPPAVPGPPAPCPPTEARPSCRITSPEEIKQEALRRLQLRRQNSSPDLTLRPSEEPRPTKSRTVEALAPPALRRPPAGRLHIPTFEEFKKMRQKEGGPQKRYPSTTGGQSEPCGDQTEGETKRDQIQGEAGGGDSGVEAGAEQAGNTESTDSDCGRSFSTTESSEFDGDSRREGLQDCQDRGTDAPVVPICTSPMPRPPLQPLATPQEAEVGGTISNTKEDMSGLIHAHLLENSHAPPTCCPALLLDGTDLSSYGAKISKMKDGFFGSALDLIKKSCSAEITAEAPVRLARDRDGADITPPQPARQSTAVSMTMPACSTEDHNKPAAGGGEPAERQPSPGCRRSSSDAAYEPADSAKTQRECRLRPHFSDPMPADTAKRKQLEMKIAAVARLHSQHRDRDGSARARPEPGGGDSGASLIVTRGTQHRWSNVSSLSADSGVVGLSDEREDRDDDEEPPSRARRSADVERVDSGIGPGLARGWKRPSASLRAWEAQRPCPDCGQRDAGRSSGGDRMCERCLKQRTERKEAILEFLNTESSYGEDLRIIKEEFLCPMQSAGLLTPEQLAVVFGNVQELIDVNDKFTEHLQDSTEQAFDQGDEDLLTVCIGEIFLEFVNMLPAFQTYCLQQSAAVNMLNTLEKEKELLRIFLDVSQNDNTALRRMNLRSFLMAPLQRVTKYPLLLSRISKATAESHPDHARLREAKSRVESHLEHINTRTKQEGATWSLRSFRRDSRRSREVANMEMRELCMRTVGWARESTRFVMEGPLQISQPADGQWVKKGSKALKFQNLQSLLMVQIQGAVEGPQEGSGPRGQEPSPEPVRDGVLVLIKDKSSGKFSVLREPIRLGNCVVSTDPECDDTFEVLDIRRDAFVLRAADKSRTQQWFRQIKRYSRDLGPWRKRRNALPNIMISTAQNRS
ncbi:hypothetical protein SKAU_G00231100 [Synaphobranchus kaupii]|uniref:DH domain-containing protein n=1 Tax=Synaphobranchus kaupii TaxID=118154 RepID=A0A9Q1F5P3_SYNKA|nr:hypothetical protein SKAU_G00231100 [Synaphobranchus kaupii]